MNDFDAEPEPFPGMEDLMARLHRAEKVNHDIFQMCEEENDKAENKLLVKLWQQLGDQTETYWEAMVATKAFVNAVGKARRSVVHLPNSIKRLLLQSVAEVLQGDVETLRKIDEIKLRHQHGAPPRTKEDET